jgi:hypothetical protein
MLTSVKTQLAFVVSYTPCITCQWNSEFNGWAALLPFMSKTVNLIFAVERGKAFASFFKNK